MLKLLPAGWATHHEDLFQQRDHLSAGEADSTVQSAGFVHTSPMASLPWQSCPGTQLGSYAAMMAAT
jgi:hypothetical protein